jgi:hypothetical protein
MGKKRTRAELAFPVPATIPMMNGTAARPKQNPEVIRSIIRSTIQGAFCRKTPSEPSSYSSEYGKPQKPIVTSEEVNLVTHLIESLQPADAIEAALASQFAITYIRGLHDSQEHHKADVTMNLFRFTHEVLECLIKYRTKGAQLINVSYHNSGMINNININEKDNKTIEV